MAPHAAFHLRFAILNTDEVDHGCGRQPQAGGGQPSTWRACLRWLRDPAGRRYPYHEIDCVASGYGRVASSLRRDKEPVK